MIELLTGLPEGTIGFKATGKVTGEDYDTVLTKAVDRALEEHEHIKLLVVVGPDFEGCSLESAWDDTRLDSRILITSGGSFAQIRQNSWLDMPNSHRPNHPAPCRHI